MNINIFKIAGALGLFMLGGLWPPNRAWGAVEESFVLANGLKVILVEQPGSPVVSLRVMIRTGAADESGRSEYGLAHLMEHMAFKGSTRYPDPGKISSQIERNGGDMNAYTSSDATVYYINMPSDQAVLGLDILADLVFHPLYDPKEYELEKEVVIEEIKRGRDNPDRLLMENFFAAAYPDHPYGRPVIGFEETVRGASVAEAKDFHRRHYRPDNAVLVVTGGFDKEAVRQAIDKYYAALPQAAEARQAQPAPALAPASGPVLKVEQSDKVALAKVIIGFRGPAGQDPEAPLMDLLSSVLSGGKSSRLTEIVKDAKGLVTDISSGSYTPRYQGSFFISLETEPAKVSEAVAPVWEELERLGSEPPAEDELARARALAEKSFLSGQETALGLAAQITEFENLFGDWRLRDAYLPLWNRISPAELGRAASEFFKAKNMTVSVLLPQGEAGQTEAYPTAEELAELARRLDPPPVDSPAKTAPQFQLFTLKAGPRLLIMRDASLGLVTVRAAALGGLLADGPHEAGLSNFMSAVWTKATQDKPAPDLARAFENIGASISAFAGRNSVGLAASFLAGRRDEGFRLFCEVLRSPAFNPEDVDKVRPEIEAQIKAQDEQLSARLMRLLASRLYPDGHPYSRSPLGTLASVSQMDAAALRRVYDRCVRPEELVIAVAGDVEPLKTRQLLEELLDGWQVQGDAKAVTDPPPPPPIEKFTEAIEELERAQTHVAYGFQVPGLGSSEGPALDLLAAYLSGMSGPLFRELRDQQSLAYTVQCGYNPGLNIGSFNFYIATDPSKVTAALAGFESIIERCRRELISPQELEGAKRYISGATKIRLQTIASRAGQAALNELYGLGLDYEEKRLAAIEKVTAEQVREVAAKYLLHQHAVLAIVGQAPQGSELKSGQERLKEPAVP